MRFYTKQHPFYCGIDLHADAMYVCFLDSTGEVVVHKSMLTRPKSFLKLIKPYRENMVVGCECMVSWYWLADLCAEQDIQFVLGHALYMRAIHGCKKIGNAHLRWAFGEAVIHMLKGNKPLQAQLQKMASRHGKGKALAILSHRLGRSVYFILKNQVPFDQEKFMRNGT